MLFAAMQLVAWIGIAITVWALIDCAVRPAAAFPAVERQTKVAWLCFLALAAVVQVLLGTVSLLGIAAIVLAVYYLVDVRAKVLAITRR